MGTAIFIVIIVGVVGLGIVLRYMGTKQVSVRASANLDATRQAVDNAFSKAIWTRTGGPGDMNFIPRLRQHPPTLSVSFSGSSYLRWV